MSLRAALVVLFASSAPGALATGCGSVGDGPDARASDAAALPDVEAARDAIDASDAATPLDASDASDASDACVPACTARVCGSDGCGGTCGACAAGQTCNAAGACTVATPPPGGHQLWIAFDSGTAVSRTHTEAFFHCALEHTDFNALAMAYGTGRALAFGGAATLEHSCPAVQPTTATVVDDTATFSCIEAQTGWAIGDDDVLLYYPTFAGCQNGRNHWHIPVSGAGHSASVEVALGFTGSGANCQTALGTHEVFEAASEPRAADCCNGQDGCAATPAAYGWYTLSACGTTYTAQAVSPPAHEFDAHYCAELH